MNKFELASIFGSSFPVASTPEEERQRKQTRQRLEASFPKCRCGSTARKGEVTCRSCGERDYADESARAAVSDAEEKLANALHEAGVTDYSLIAEAIADLIEAKITAAKASV